MAAVSRLVSDQDLLKGSRWHAVDCIVRFVLTIFTIPVGTLQCYFSMIYSFLMMDGVF